MEGNVRNPWKESVMKNAGADEARSRYLEERIRYLEEANRIHMGILDTLASSDEFQAELNKGKNAESIFHATLVQVKRILPFEGMCILENQDDSSFQVIVCEPEWIRAQLEKDVEKLILSGTFSWALNRNQPIMAPSEGAYTCLLHVIATHSRIRGMFIGRLPFQRKAIDTPSLNALTITLRTAAHALESCTLYGILHDHLHTLEQTVKERTAELETTATELKITNEKLMALSDSDPLTGLYNRRFLMGSLEKEVAKAKHKGTFFSIIIMDIDNFKSINDGCGHQNGDRVLISVAEISKASMRSRDTIARYGGEEFVAILPETSLQGAVSIAERLRESVHSLRFHAPMENIKVTLSLGVATFPSPGVDSVDSLFAQADRALYKAKRGGRNRVETACPDPTPCELQLEEGLTISRAS